MGSLGGVGSKGGEIGWRGEGCLEEGNFKGIGDKGKDRGMG